MYYSASNNAFYPETHRRRYESAGTWPADAVQVTDQEWQQYGASRQPDGKQRGADEQGRPTWVPTAPPNLDTLAARKRKEVESCRKAAEAKGVIVNGVRYSGDAGNRQALREALVAADELGNDTFKLWKDSNGQFHKNHPVRDVREALHRLIIRRSELINHEGELVHDIDDALSAKDRDIIGAINW